MSKVLTIGTFDLFHYGHSELFRKCRVLAGTGEVVVGVNSNFFIKDYKGSMPIVDENARIAVIRDNRHVDRVVMNRDAGATLIRQERPDILVVGSDWATKDYYNQVKMRPQDFEKQGTLLVYVPYTEGISTTAIKEKLSGDN